MIFTLEALQARHGDCLILHFGPETCPHFIVIDGGPSLVYQKALRPRLNQLCQRWGDGDETKVLALDMVMVSHIDDDHINGIAALFDDLADRKACADGPQPYRIGTLWFNSFNDVIGTGAQQIFTNVPASATASTLKDSFPGLRVKEEEAAVIASVSQGRQLRKQAELLQVKLNVMPHPKTGKATAGGMIMVPRDGTSPFNWGDSGLRFTVLAPEQARLEKLWKEWQKAAKKHAKGDAAALPAAYTDQSPYNLSSIVVLVELEGKRMLLTGDARGDYIIAGLIKAGLLKSQSDSIHFDVLKLPHHGSDRNMEAKFFRRVTADHYVVSADGKYDNPDMGTLQWIADARGDAPYQIHLTNGDGEHDLGARLKTLMKNDTHLAKNIRIRGDDELSLRVELGQSISY